MQILDNQMNVYKKRTYNVHLRQMKQRLKQMKLCIHKKIISTHSLVRENTVTTTVKCKYDRTA